MANSLFRMREFFSGYREAPPGAPELQTVRLQETPSAEPDASAPPRVTSLQPLKSWSHPFKDKKPALMQLTQLAKATGGYYPLGRNGLWHGGVHFDSGTAGTLEQSSVHCLADGEVVAYRIDEHSPSTTYFVNALTVQKPFSRNFVLVRHRLQAPAIEGSPDVPPSVIFYSLYMHLQDWSVYKRDPAITRPIFWPEGETRRVKPTVSDLHPDHPGQPGLNVRSTARVGKVLALLQRGAQVTVSGEGDYRKLENTKGPDVLKNADGSLRGYVCFQHLIPIAGDEYRINANPTLYVRAEANARSQILTKLPDGAEVTVSGQGAFRKLERINQYVHFNSLEGAREPLADRITVLDQPIAIKAGDLIGHIGLYQDSAAEHPEAKLHLEVFSGDDMELFIEASQAWALRLPASGKTWLKLPKGTPVVAHQDRFNATQPPTLRDISTPSDADLWVPKSLLNGLSAENKIIIPATAERAACNWYQLDGLLHDAHQKLLDGWVREEVGITQWVNPWAWEGYQTIYNYETPRQSLASFLRAVNRLNADQLERHGALADMSDKGPMKSRLYDVIDRDRNGKITAEELQAAMELPAHAQSLSQLIIHYESEWYYKPQKWDALDEVLGHSGSTPHLNWLAEKERIKQISWWSEVATKVGLPVDGQVFHLHPVGLASHLQKMDDCVCGCCLGAIFISTRYRRQYGPVYWGKSKLEDFQGWDELVSKGKATSAEREILVAMSENEGNLDAIQSYDSEVLTAGVMQKTINPQGAGELPIQVFEFQQMYPDLYQALFEDCGWQIRTESNKHYLYYNGVTGNELKTILRDGFTQKAFEERTRLASRPLAVFANAIATEEYLAKQVIDFIDRLRIANAISPSGYGLQVISDYIRSNLGKALVLDHHVNRPSNVSRDFSEALQNFFILNSMASQDPRNWGINHAEYESALLDIYGPSRRMTDASQRYLSLKRKL